MTFSTDLVKNKMGSYKPIIIESFDTFILSRRLASMLTFVKKNKFDRVSKMLQEAHDNILCTKTDILDEHKDILCGIMVLAINEINACIAPSDVLESYINMMSEYVDRMMDGFEKVYNELKDPKTTLPGNLDVLPIELREIVANFLAAA